ncbi:MAG TPA: 3-phosphoshikimate 1-carboxyvinyltransferase [Deltaproteobacteria bacterium]|nr:MAG: 3-phosphoshikimate 1-carboxyvinyltransferase [Deltaproteobacteria bacterium GWB2_65_81]OGP36458.1 MAG: 3-phosphoshikimate 1-carboxyvinyltransferase [Deltaproteobacteria bacterium GWC2_66_88]HAM32647.1 3-phosphoshikimate 1-carboxyvinyltransferase [Deltaproteobacteria bacterium]HBG73699.1 3-phosphoshikimate 1-carboxyvinyltransferase [Deltaproteobacteria bacterium]
MSGKTVFRGELSVPGDKSISHRAAMFAALATGVSRVRGFLHAEDTLSTAGMMRALGARIEEVSPTELRIEGKGLRALVEPSDVIDAGNSGTTIRIGSGILAAQPFLSVLTGDRTLRRRPMGRVIEPLVKMGASIRGRDGNRLPPLCIRGGSLRGIRYEMPVASAQVKSSLLLAGLYADSPVTVVEPLLSRDHTERMLKAMGAIVSREGNAVTVAPCERLDPLDVTVPGDISSAAFFLVLAAVTPGSSLTVRGVGVNPFRTGVVEVLRRMGAGIRYSSERVVGGEPVADLVVCGAELAPADVAPEEVPGLIDEVPALCVAAVFAAGRTKIRGAGELRVKESDRIAAMVACLSSLGIPCGEYPDGLWVEGPAAVRPGISCDSRGDHRIAMSLRVLGAAAGVPIEVKNVECIDTSFPGFQSLLDGLTR